MKKELTQRDLWYFTKKKEVPDLLGHTVISPMHYGDTVEIHLNRGFEGEAIINGQHFTFKEKNVYFIPPRFLHSFIYTKGGSKENDMIGAFHINLELLKPILNIERMLYADNRTLLSYSIADHDFDLVWSIITDILNPDRLLSAKLCDLLRLFEVINVKTNLPQKDIHYNPSVIQIVDLVERSYSEKLTVEKAASHFNFSSCYFCRWFKKQTGITFNEYVNAVRITHACTFLQNGCSVATTAEKCGFYDTSYFIKVFRRFLGITPLEYVEKPKKIPHFLE